MPTASGSFRVVSWDERPYHEEDGGPKLARATVSKTITGEIEGKSAVEYLLAYAPDGSAGFVGLERFTGRIGERSGSVIFQHTGSDGGGTTSDTWTIVPGSGTGELAGIRGEGESIMSGHAETYPMQLTYELD